MKVKHNDTKSDLWKDFKDVKTILMYGDKVTTKTKSKVIQMATGKLREGQSQQGSEEALNVVATALFCTPQRRKRSSAEPPPETRN